MVKRIISKIILYLIIIVLSMPILVGFAWIIICSFSMRTYGLIPMDREGHFGGFVLSNWAFLKDPKVWILVFNTLMLGTGLTIGVLIISALAGYALSRINFAGRKTILSATLILHAFPNVTLLIAIYFVLRWISKIPLIGKGLPVIGGIGFNTLGGVILVSIALQLPLGIWLMKGFFDNVSWDIERAALIDGCSRFRTWWQIMIPQIKPGLAAKAIMAFISGWNSFLIPYTYLLNAETAVISTYLKQLMGDTAAINYGTVAAFGLFQLIPVLIFYLFTQKYLLNIFGSASKGGV